MIDADRMSATAKTDFTAFLRQSRQALARYFAIFGLALSCCLAVFAPDPAGAQQRGATLPSANPQQSSPVAIAAIVNDDIITVYDLQQRMRLLLMFSGIQPTPETIDRIQDQVLRNMVDERLELQEANRLEVNVDESEIKQALDDLASRGNLTGDALLTQLDQAGIDRRTLLDQIKAEIAWGKLVQGRFGQLANVSEQRIDETMNQLKEGLGEEQYLVSEIYLPFEGAGSRSELQRNAERLVDELKRGASFPGVAAQFSQAPSAANGGDIGWVQASQLPAPVANRLSQLSTTEIAGPIETEDGLYVVQLRGRRAGEGGTRQEYSLIHVLFPVDAEAPQSAVMKRVSEAQALQANFSDCAAVPEQVSQYDGVQASPPRTLASDQMDPALRDTVADLGPGQAAEPIRSPRGIEMILVCDKVESAARLPSREQIDQQLYAEQLSMMARRYLRDLRRDSVIEER